MALLATAAAVAAVAPAAANADSSTSLTVIGTSDVSDSGLMQNVIEPAFHAAYPQFTFKYIGTATGTAIASAESGSQGASVLLVHAASLENQFVAGGYSYDNQYGNAVFTNDFVLAGSAADPAGVLANAPNNIAQAFADVAAAGIAGKAQFISRGGTPGTTVEEHAIWQLVDQNGLSPAGLLLCDVSATNGGGETPIAANQGVTANGQPCPNSGALPTGKALPSWYTVTGLTQGPNVVAANACTSPSGGSYPSGPNTCYVLTDRSTYDYLASGLDSAGSIPNLGILTRNNLATAPGGANALINYFHAYVINPSSAGQTVNLPAAQDFVSLLASPSLQAQLKYYLDDTTDVSGAPFIATASPAITAVGFPANVNAGKTVTVSGSVTNLEQGYPALNGVTVDIDEIEAGVPVIVAHGVTAATGTYSITFQPKSSGEYQVSTPQLSVVENSTLSPVFGDILSPGASAAAQVTVNGLSTAHLVKFNKLTIKGTKATITGALKPPAALNGGKVQLLGVPASSNGKQKVLGKASPKKGVRSFTINAKLKAGTWVLQLKYSQKGQTTVYSGVRVKTVK
jgi:ABC-type tungstate transport system permease subunit